MKKTTTKTTSGYILIVTLLMIAGMTAIGTYIFLRSSVFLPFMHTMYDREKAKVLAMGGLQIAIQQLSQFDEAESEQTTNSQAAGQQPAGAQTANQQAAGQQTKPKQEAGGPLQLFTRIMPIINRWQTFPLQKKIDGIDGSIQVCLVCEEGKINLNRIYNFDKSEFRGQGQPKGDWQKIMGLVCKQIEEVLGGKELFAALEGFLKKRTYPLYDITELLTIKEFAIFRNHVFYQPAHKNAGDNKGDGKANIYLTDLFTTFSDKNTIEPRFFSDSLLAILKLAQTASTDQAKRAEQVSAMEKTFKQNAQWPSDWGTQLKPFYEKELPSAITGLDSVLSTQFNPTQFSVFTYGTVGTVTQRLLAIVKRNKRARNGKTGYDMSISKIYWL